jgi:methyltransferase (TIGR00027 family)
LPTSHAGSWPSVARVRTVPDLPQPARPGTSRTALAALQTQALLELGSPDGGGIAVGLYASAAAHGGEQLETASDPAAYRAAVLAGALPGPGHIARFAARKRWMADAAMVAIADGIRQIVFLGAGFDTLGLTLLHADATLLVVELDQPAMVEAKELALAAAKIARPWPRFAAIDLTDTRALTGALVAVGWRTLEPALFVAELALEYLEPEAAFAVLNAVGTLLGPESRIACTVRFGDVDDDRIATATAAVGEPMRFRPLSAELPELLARAGLDVLASRDRILGRGGTTALLLLGSSKTTQATETAP